MNVAAISQKQSKFFWLAAGSAAILLIGVIDYLTGHDIAFSLFYLIPITALAWYTGRPAGIAASIASAAVWLLADIGAGNPASRAVIYWNGAVRLSFFLVVTLLMTSLKRSTERVMELAQVDGLTGAANTRHLSELLTREIDRSQRDKQPFSLAYIDLDNFKTVNDSFGHSTGDKVLQSIVQQAREKLRKVDTVARLGGDEFALLLPETDGPAARTAVQRVIGDLKAEMQRNGWPVTFSVGVLTCLQLPPTSDELIKRADDLMYSVKNNGKDSVCYSTFETKAGYQDLTAEHAKDAE